MSKNQRDRALARVQSRPRSAAGVSASVANGFLNWKSEHAPRDAEGWQMLATFAAALLEMGDTRVGMLEEILTRAGQVGVLPEQNPVPVFIREWNRLVRAGKIKGGQAALLPTGEMGTRGGGYN